MPSLRNAMLDITISLPAKTAKVVVDCDVQFRPFDLEMMKLGLRHRLSCKIYGDDLIRDDYLFSYPDVFFPDATPVDCEHVKFERTVSLRVLNEDAGTDEIYGRLILKNLEDGSTRTLNTNVIKHKI